ncbi:hypothetical protein [Microbacterium sp. UBA3486]|uniref:hypothetical protein n=1 Tax=Microbacterium TaxID=33882 RepID=UPI0025D273A1|nr:MULTISPECIES: hypothetical protein [Microbacterium]
MSTLTVTSPNVETTPTRSLLAAIEAIEQKQAALSIERDQLLTQMLSDLSWMDIPVLRLSRLSVGNDLRKAITTGTHVHVVRQYEELGSYDMLMAHQADSCEWICRGAAGAIVKGGGPTRWRFRCEGEYEYIGTIEGEQGTEFLFIGAQKEKNQ